MNQGTLTLAWVLLLLLPASGQDVARLLRGRCAPSPSSSRSPGPYRPRHMHHMLRAPELHNGLPPATVRAQIPSAVHRPLALQPRHQLSALSGPVLPSATADPARPPCSTAATPPSDPAASLSFLVQAPLIIIASALVAADLIPHTAAATSLTGGPLFLELIPIALLAFQSAGCLAATRFLGFSDIPIVVLTSVYFDIASDPHLLRSPLKNAERNRRVCGAV
ncbi:uncharacterized protein BO95DRAFT_506678 [Aspergillus brunneoviolaceus CBS 621.78]|uniref:Uncharacterized protein n=2 Tax=Aspergillus brunneoviolaceus CBS 621.78 TaxID=1450534 RepID=A0ACD1GKC7_9EURO|nr:hypothetical protein BO95DRAFT_506618 [Aspergillus brunneoviolaceus CBS 621.78]XP_025446114.1 hypothetical protein BO95DRAFT_506678 [Aspergillus brunneoviolaceus CBS 621.78]RAH49567.1 hypothetical protein BO95DRAFT_506618 [Aspergillus brunneoviolaceus CBS 621.78]RAH49593.1 hypothetical protein BO95DRAFT_506678 [Aspergillus brunneoviolaceus CBS 621.78]